MFMKKRTFIIFLFYGVVMLTGVAPLFLKPTGMNAAESSACTGLSARLGVGRDYSVSGRALSLSVGDFNADGNPDLATAESHADDATVTIMLGDGTGYLETISRVPLVGILNMIVTGDLNKDGKLDLVVSGVTINNTNGIATLLGNGDGTFQTVGYYPSGSGANALALGDFDGDGHSDVAVVSQFVTELAILRGHGNGSFGQATIYAGVGGNSIGVADFNGDGKLDLATSGRLMINDGSGMFRVLDAPFRGSGLAVGDLNADGKSDVVITTTNLITVYLGDGQGGFVDVPKNYSNGLSAQTVIRDFNGDGKQDLACANNAFATGSVVVLFGAGAGEFGEPVEYGGGKSPYALQSTDFNQDGKLDLAVLNLDSGNEGVTQISLLLGKGLGGFEAPFIAEGGSFPTAIAGGDLNKDGKPELLILNRSSRGVSVALNNGQGMFGKPQSYGVSDDSTAMVIRDFDKDGNPDLAVANNLPLASPSGQVSVLFGRGDGSFERFRTRVFKVGEMAVDLVASDFNGDGAADLAVVNSVSNDVSIALNMGNGEFGAVRNLAVGHNPGSLVTGDFNGDNKSDLVVANRDTLSILLGNGDGSFAVQPFNLPGPPHSLHAVDLNNDGKLDLIVPQKNAPTVSVFLGNGDGSFGAPVNSNLGRLPFSIVVNDFNADSKLDLAATVFLGGDFTQDKVLFFVGDGAGKFNAGGGFPIRFPRDLETTDFNGDGLADLAVLTSGEGRNTSVSVVLGQCNFPGTKAMISVSAASYHRLNLASEMIIAAFGAGLSTETASAVSLPLPTQLAGTQIMVKDRTGSERAASLFFVSPGQINYLLPSGLAPGMATITVTNNKGLAASETTLISPVAPGLFTANATGQGVAAGVALRVKPDGSQIYEPLARFDPAQNQFIPAGFDLYGVHPPNINDQVFLILFGTGLRGRSALSNVRAWVGNVEIPVLFAGEQGQLIGLDQINLLLPKSLGKRFELEVFLTVDGKLTNPVRIYIL